MNSKYKDKLVGVYAPGNYGHASVVIVYYDNMPDSEHVFNNKNDAINELNRLRGVKYRNSRMYTVEMEEVEA